VVEVDPHAQLFWADAVPCEQIDEGKVVKTVKPVAGASYPSVPSGAQWICLLNEERVRYGRYRVMHFDIREYQDNGPPALDQIVEACRLIDEAQRVGGGVVVFCPADGDGVAHRDFSALCVAAYSILVRKASASSAAEPWAALAKAKPAPRGLPWEDCLGALEMARDRGWLDMATFDTEAYRALWLRFDACWLIPGSILLMADPMSTVLDPNPKTVSVFVPPSETAEAEKDPTPMTCTSFASLFAKAGLRLTVQLNFKTEPGLAKSYNPEDLNKGGVDHLDASYDDVGGGVPSSAVIRKILDKCTGMSKSSNDSGPVVAFHCKSGFGRSVTCAVAYAVYRYELPGRALLAWARICRPGSITTPQQAKFLAGLEDRVAVEERAKPAPECCALS